MMKSRCNIYQTDCSVRPGTAHLTAICRRERYLYHSRFSKLSCNIYQINNVFNNSIHLYWLDNVSNGLG